MVVSNIFFFSSRRRHTRFDCDWSSDVCSSDLLIKANFPCRIAFRVSAKVDSRTILDQNGAETMLGNGDMLFLPPGKSALLRVQGAFISTDETERLMDWYKAHAAQAASGTSIDEQVTALEEREKAGEDAGEGGR